MTTETSPAPCSNRALGSGTGCLEGAEQLTDDVRYRGGVGTELEPECGQREGEVAQTLQRARSAGLRELQQRAGRDAEQRFGARDRGDARVACGDPAHEERPRRRRWCDRVRELLRHRCDELRLG